MVAAQKTARIWQPGIGTAACTERSVSKPAIKLIIACLAITGIVLGLVNPKVGTKMETVKREGIDIVFAIDVSKSMLAEDIAPSRLEKPSRSFHKSSTSWAPTGLALSAMPEALTLCCQLQPIIALLRCSCRI